MKETKNNKLYWRRLDNSAKIFPISGGKKYSTVFRLSVILKENVQPEILKQAVQLALERYKSFKVREIRIFLELFRTQSKRTYYNRRKRLSMQIY